MNLEERIAAIFGMASMVKKEPASVRRLRKDRRPYTPPRSMTVEEAAFYDKNKHLNGFYK